MAKRKRKQPKKRRPAETPSAFRDTPATLTVQNPHAAGMDVHADQHTVCVGPGVVQEFGASTADRHALGAHVRAHGVTTVALESTSIYWIPLDELREAEGFAVALMAPGPLKHCGARPKTDVLDAQGIQRLHTYGLRRASFRPPETILPLRAYGRQRPALIRLAAMHVPHRPKALEQMHVKRTEVLSASSGVTGLAISAAILAGQRDPQELARRRHPQCAKAVAEIAGALEGTWREEHLFELKQADELCQCDQQKVSACDQQIALALPTLPDRPGGPTHTPRPRPRGRQKNDVRFEATGPLVHALGVDWTRLPGMDVATALVGLAESGVAVSKFPTAKHFASGLGVGPRDGKSHPTIKKQAPRKGKHRLGQALRMAAQAVGRTQTVRGAFDRRLKSRLGGKGAVTATAHQLAVLIERMLKHGTEYVAQALTEYEAKLKGQRTERLRKQAQALGFDLQPTAGAPPAS